MKHFLQAVMLLAAMAIASCSQQGKEALILNSEKDLSGLTLTCSAGNYYDHKYSGRGDITMLLTNTEADAVQAVRQGLADVYVADEVMLTKEDRRRLGLKKAMNGEEVFDVAFAIRKGNDSLLTKLNEFISTFPVADYISHWLEGTPEVEEPAYTIKKGAAPLRCICAANMAPISFIGEGGEWMGMDPDILRRFAHYLGRPFEMTFQNLGSAVIALQTGQADIICNFLYITEERKKSVDFSIPYYKCRSGFFVKDNGNEVGLSLMERLQTNLIKEGRWKLITGGLWETVKITLFAILLGSILGIGICSMVRSRRRWLRSTAVVYNWLMAGIPMLVLLLILFYVVLAKSGLDATIVSIIAFALNFSSGASDVYGASLDAIPHGQTEAGLAMGFTRMQTFLHIVLPQAIKRGLPLYQGICISLLKGTSIVGYIAIQDITRAGDLIRSRTFDALIPLLVVTIIYFLLAWLLGLLIKLATPKTHVL